MYKILAERNPDISEEQIKELVTHFCRHFRNTLSSLDHGMISFPGMGMFYIKPNVLDKEEMKLADWENTRIEQVRERRRIQYQKVQELQEFFRVEKLKKAAKRLERNAYIQAKEQANGEDKTSMEVPE